MLKTCGRLIPDWRNQSGPAAAVCKKQRKCFDFLFYKRQNVRIFAQKFPEVCGPDYGAYRACAGPLWKTRWKKWKTSWKTPFFLHKNGGKPGGKSEKFIPDRKLHTIAGCIRSPAKPPCRCISGPCGCGFSTGRGTASHRGLFGAKNATPARILECPGQSWYNNTGKLRQNFPDKRGTLYEQLAEPAGAQI